MENESGECRLADMNEANKPPSTRRPILGYSSHMDQYIVAVWNKKNYETPTMSGQKGMECVITHWCELKRPR